MNAQENKKGFTIIEVVLVLAIAGLIFLMVFIALPALQRGQRDNQRKNDMSRVLTAVQNYSSANRGNIPNDATKLAALKSQYLLTAGDSFVDPSGAVSGQSSQDSYNFSIVSTSTTLPQTFSGSGAQATQNIIYVTPSATCSTGTAGGVEVAGSRKIAFRMVLEGGGIQCQNN